MAGDPNAEKRSPTVQKALSVIDLGIQASTAYNRADLAKRLTLSRRRLSDPSFHVFIVGEFKQGKSSLVNALLNAPVCPVDDDIATAAPTAVRYAEEPSAAVLLKPTDESPSASDDEVETIREEIPIEEVANYVTEAANPENERRVHTVEVSIPRKMLADGLVIMDTPGVGGLGSAHSAATIGALPMADAVVFVSDSSQEFTAPELEFLKTAQRMCPNLICVMTKTDFYPSWRKIRDINTEHLRREGIDTRLLCVSSALRIHALRNNDRELNQESGFPELVGFLQNDIASNAEKIMVRNAANDVVSVTGMLESQFQTERQALQQSPEQNEQTVAHLSELKAKAQALKTSKWQQTLSDGIADLQTDLDHDLRSRIRQITKQADDAIEASDPAETWEEFEPWLLRRVAEDVANTYTFLFARSDELALRVAENFGEDGKDLSVHLDIGNPHDLVAEIDAHAQVDTETMGAGEALMSGMKGGYGGVLMFGMMGSLAGLMLINPATVAIGFFMGRKAVKQEKERQLQQRRAQAKQAHRKYTDDVGFLVNKDSRDTLRRIQRQFRDFFTTRAEELLKSTTDSLNAAQKAAQSDQSTRQKRLKDVNAEIERIAALRKRALEVAPELAGQAGGK
jgi:GTPase Era involved in 16S rRNA processing